MKKIVYSSRIFLLTVSITIMFASVVKATSTNIQIDNTLPGIASHHINPVGGGYTLSEIDGKVAGHNLFYSFSDFSIGTNDAVVFDLVKLPGLTNVISRVTGGSESVIDGSLKMMHASAPSFFFINPAGITFKSGALIDVPGSFYTGTASTLNFNDGSQYIAHETHISTLSAASPESFGFLGNEAGSINIGNSLEVKPTLLTFYPGREVAYVANQIYINDAIVTDINTSKFGPYGNKDDGINLQIIATGNGITQIRPGIHPDQPVVGDLTIENSILNVSGNGSGYLAVQSGNFNLLNNKEPTKGKNFNYDIGLFAHNTGDKSLTGVKGIDVFVQSNMSVDYASIRSDSDSKGAGSPVNINVKGSLSIFDRGRITTNVNKNGTGAAGAITVHAGQLTIDGARAFENFSPGSGDVDTDFFDANSISSKTFDKGDAGSVTVSVDGTLHLLKTGNIASLSQGGGGDAGVVTVTARDMIIEDSKLFTTKDQSIKHSGISVSTIGSGGKAGTIDVAVMDSLKITNNGAIDSDSSGMGSGGRVTVKARQLEMSNDTFITSDVLNEGDGGQVIVNVTDTLHLLNDSRIASRAFSGKGNGGQVDVSTRQMEVNHGSISSSTLPSSTGNAGDVVVTVVDTLKITNSGTIESKTSSATGAAGSVTVEARQIKIDGLGSQISSSAENLSHADAGKINILFKDLLFLDDSSKISTTAINGNGGGIIVARSIAPDKTIMERGDIVYLRNSAITTSVTGDPGGNGGDITIGARNLILNGGFIQANTNVGETAGKVDVSRVIALIPSSNSITFDGPILPSQEPGLNVIQADAPQGFSQPVKAPPPQLNLSGMLANLAIESFDSNTLNRSTCTVEEGNSLLQSGKGGLPMRARDFLLMPSY